jgi:hypothetical protein
MKIGGAFALAALAAVLVPRLEDGSSGSPAVTTLLVTALCIGVLTIGALYLALTGDLGLPKTIALYIIGFNALVVLVKFVLSPEALYERSENGSLEVFFDLNRGFDAAVVAVAVFALYAAALYVVYRICRRGLESRSLGWKRVLGVGAVAAVLLISTGSIVLVAAWGGLEYVGIVLSSGVSVLVAGALVGAIFLASAAFRASAARAELLGDAALLVSVFWVALAFLVLYHVLWVVYILVLTSIWPLKVITPK